MNEKKNSPMALRNDNFIIKQNNVESENEIEVKSGC